MPQSPNNSSRLFCSWCGAVGGLCGGLVGFAVHNIDYFAHFVTYGLSAGQPFIGSPSQPSMAAIAAAWGALWGAAFGAIQKPYHRSAAWFGVCIGFCASLCCFPVQQRIRE